MNTEKKYGIFIFRRDLRIHDNKGLNNLFKEVDYIIPIFIFDKNQCVKNNKNKYYFSDRALKFICECIDDLNNELKQCLNIYFGDYITIINTIIKQLKDYNIIFGFNMDYSKYSVKRDNDILKLLDTKKINYICNYNDFTLCDMDLLIKNDGQPFKKFKSFKDNLLNNEIKMDYIYKIKFHKQLINKLNYTNYHKLYKVEEDYDPVFIGNRKTVLNILNNVEIFKDYEKNRNYLNYDTLRISAYLNFGLISIRETYLTIEKKIKKSDEILSQLIWRDYYLCLLRYLEGTKDYNKHVDKRYDNIKWLNDKNKKEWYKMMESKTGFLLVDACIKELLTTGYLHNRGRLIIGYFTVKHLFINPLHKKYGLNVWFSKYLTDCLTSQNKLNCQFITEFDYSGKKFSKKIIDGRPFNVDNVNIKKYDPECIYIKKWLPHLKDVPNKQLIQWNMKYDIKIHPKPMFERRRFEDIV